MSKNKNVQLRYNVLDRCFRNPGKQYYIQDLLDTCNVALSNSSNGTDGIQRRQLFKDIEAMKEIYNAPIESISNGAKEKYYRYTDPLFSIQQHPSLNELEARQLRDALQLLANFKGLPQFDWIDEISSKLQQEFDLGQSTKVIGFEENIDLKGKDLISDIYNYIVNKRVIKVQYRSFKQKENEYMTIHPYFLKQYNCRWFLFGYNNDYSTLSNMALDRIVGITETHLTYIPNTEIDFDEYFDNMLGVNIPKNAVIEKIILKVDKQLWPYIKTKPIHGTQKIKEINENYTLIQIELYINYEFESFILSKGESIEVIEPLSLKTRIEGKIKKMSEVYFSCAH